MACGAILFGATGLSTASEHEVREASCSVQQTADGYVQSCTWKEDPGPGPGPEPPIPPIPGEPWGVRPAPAWVADLPIGEWTTVGTNTMHDVCAGKAWGYPDTCLSNPWTAVGRFDDHINTWCGATIARGLGAAGVYVTGMCGGHGAQHGSDTYGFDLETATWSRLTEPYGSLDGSIGTSTWNCWDGVYPDKSPMAPHNGQSVEVIERDDGRIYHFTTQTPESPTSSGPSPNNCREGNPFSGTQYQPLRGVVRDMLAPYEHTLDSSSWRLAPFPNPKCRTPEASTAECPKSEYPSATWDHARQRMVVVQHPISNGYGFNNEMYAYDIDGASGEEGRIGSWERLADGPGSGFWYMGMDHAEGLDVYVMSNFGHISATGSLYVWDPQNPANGYQRIAWQGEAPENLWAYTGLEYSALRSTEEADCLIYHEDRLHSDQVWEVCIDREDGRQFDSATWEMVAQGGDAPPQSLHGVWSRGRIARFEMPDDELAEVYMLSQGTQLPVHVMRLPARGQPPVPPPDGALKDASWDAKCASDGVTLCYRFDSPASVDEVYNQAYAQIPAEFDPQMFAAKLHVGPGTNNVTGTLEFVHPPIGEGGDATQYWLQYKYLPSATFLGEPAGLDVDAAPQRLRDLFRGLLRAPDWMVDERELPPAVFNSIFPSNGKMGVSYHVRSCGSNELAHAFGRWPTYYEGCGGYGYTEAVAPGPVWDYQPGGDTGCYATGVTGPKDYCFEFVADVWHTFTFHVDFDALLTKVWVHPQGAAEAIQIIEFPTGPTRTLGNLFLGIYAPKDPEIDPGHCDTSPDTCQPLWWQDVIVSTEPIELTADWQEAP